MVWGGRGTKGKMGMWAWAIPYSFRVSVRDREREPLARVHTHTHTHTHTHQVVAKPRMPKGSQQADAIQGQPPAQQVNLVVDVPIDVPKHLTIGKVHTPARLWQQPATKRERGGEW
jgi:hypothetical protein